jgi:hypothetical protein
MKTLKVQLCDGNRKENWHAVDLNKLQHSVEECALHTWHPWLQSEHSSLSDNETRGMEQELNVVAKVKIEFILQAPR